MLKTYIKYREILYPTEECEFFSDCVRHDNYWNGRTLIKNGEWEYVEKEIETHTITEKEYVKLEIAKVNERQIRRHSKLNSI